jgi:hypothetical protein
MYMLTAVLQVRQHQFRLNLASSVSPALIGFLCPPRQRTPLLRNLASFLLSLYTIAPSLLAWNGHILSAYTVKYVIFHARGLYYSGNQRMSARRALARILSRQSFFFTPPPVRVALKTESHTSAQDPP